MPGPVRGPDGEVPNSLVIWDEADAIGDVGLASPRNPVAVGAAFHAALLADDGPDAESLRQLVTPESLTAWGDFRAAADGLTDTGMTTRANPADGANDVVYVKYVTDPGVTLAVLEDTPVLVRALATLVWRPSRGTWLVHALGEAVPQEQVPRD